MAKRHHPGPGWCGQNAKCPPRACVSALGPQLVVLFGVRCRNFRRWSFTGGSGALWVSLEAFLFMFICGERQTRKLVT